MASQYLLDNIAKAIGTGFSETQLGELANELKQASLNFMISISQWHTANRFAGKLGIARLIVDRAHVTQTIDRLLEWANINNPDIFKEYPPFPSSAGEVKEALKVLNGNDLDKGIYLGGTYQNAILQIVASDWEYFGMFDLVRSGWFFVKALSISHAVAFFKMHVSDDGTGYVHINNVAYPGHTIWLKTDAGTTIEKDLSNGECEQWRFVWSQPSYEPK